MIVLRALEVERFRRHDHPVRVAFDDGLTVVRGANEAGKSTILQALHYAFFRRSSATGHDVEALAPWGARGVRPTVNVEFAYRGDEYRLEKSWLAGGTTRVLKRAGDGRFASFRDDGADDFVNALFCGEPHAKGAFPGFRPAHLGLGHLLFATQGRLSIADDPREPLNATAQSHLGRIVGSGTMSPAEIALARAIRSAHKNLFKDRGGFTIRAQSPRLLDEIAAVDADIACADAGVRAYESAARERDDKAAELAAVVRERERADAAVAQETPRFHNALEAKAACERRDAARAVAKQRYDATVARARAIASLRETIATLEPERRRAHEALAAADAERAAAEAARAEANVASARAHERGARVGQLRIDAHDAERRAGAARERADLRALLERLNGIDAELTAATEVVATAVAPDEAAVTALRSSTETERALAVKLDAAALCVRFTAERAANVRVTQGAPTGDRAVEAGETFDLRYDGPLAFAIPGVGRFHVSGPAVDVGDARERLAGARAEIADCRRRFGTADPFELAKRVRHAEDAARRVATLTTARAALLGGSTPIALAAREAALAAIEPIDAATHAALQRTLAEDEAAYVADVAATRHAADRASFALDAAHAARALAFETIARVERRIAAPSARLEELTADGADDAARERETAAAYLAYDAAGREAALAEEAYAPFRDIDDPAVALERCRARASDLAALVIALTGEAARLDAACRAAAERGFSARRTELVERRARLDERLQAARSDEAAVALLATLVDEIERERSASFAEPILARIAPWYRRLAGRDLAGVRLGAHQGMSGIALAGVDRPVAWHELSSGAADQLAILVRLAFASLLAADERVGRVPVVFDDPLVNCDEVRRQTMLEILTESAKHVQVIVFTCHAGAYAGSGATIASIAPLVRALAS